MTYVNHLGETINFGLEGMYVNESDLHDFKWTVVSVNDRISSFSRGVQTRRLPVRIACESAAEGIAKRNRLFEVPEKDVISKKHGRLYINGYYCECFVTESSKADYNRLENYMATDLTITTDRPVWVTERKVEILRDESWSPQSDTGVGFPLDFAFDFTATTLKANKNRNDAFVESNFRMVIHGEAVNPTVEINDHEYQVNTQVPSGKVLTINSLDQTITVSDLDGSNPENAFNDRGRDSYIFQKIPAGELDILWDNNFDIDLYLLEERSEPKWMMEVR